MRRIIAWLTATAVLTAALTVFQINFAEHEMRPVTMWISAALAVIAIILSNQANTAAGGQKTGTPGTTPSGAVANEDGSTGEAAHGG